MNSLSIARGARVRQSFCFPAILFAALISPGCGPAPVAQPPAPKTEAKPTPAAEGGKFVNLGNPAVGAAGLKFMVGPGPDGKLTHFYFGFAVKGGFILVQMDSRDQGKVRQWQAEKPFEDCWGMTPASDGNLYIGSKGHYFKFDPREPDKGLQHLGSPLPDEKYIWQMVEGRDGKIYACTYPGANLISYDPATGKFVDHGKLDPKEMYAKPLYAGADGWIYAGIGTARNQIVGFNPATGEFTYLVPEAERPAGPGTGMGWLLLVDDKDGNIFADIGGKHYRMENGRGTEVAADAAPKDPQKLKTIDGLLPYSFSSKGKFIFLDAEKKQQEGQFPFKAEPPSIFSVAALGGTAFAGVFPADSLLEYSKEGKVIDLGIPRGARSQTYSMVALPDRLYAAAYPQGTVSVYDLKTGKSRLLATLRGPNLRPMGMISLPGGRLAVGGVPDYGQRGGALTILDDQTGKVLFQQRGVIPEQSIRDMVWDDKNQCIIGGSSTVCGNGTPPVEEDARVFAWSPEGERLLWSQVAYPGDRHVAGVAVADGKVFALSSVHQSEFGPARGPKHFVVLDLKTGEILHRKDFEFGIPPDRCLAAAGGKVFGVATEGVFSIDPKTYEFTLLGKPPVPATVGIAIGDRGIYFGAGNNLWLFEMSQIQPGPQSN